MSVFALARAHARVARRQRALWFAAIPLTAFATLLAVISPARPGTGGIEDLAFSGQIIAMFTGIAYAAAFTDFFTARARLEMDECEAATPASPLGLRAARILGTLSVVVSPSVAVLVTMGIVQTWSGHPWSLPAALAVAATIVVPAALLAMSLSALAGALLPRVLGLVAGLLVWLLLIFTTPLLPLPSLNGTVFNVVGDAVASGYFGGATLYPAAGVLGVDGSAGGATVSLVAQLFAIVVLLALGSALAERTRTH